MNEHTRGPWRRSTGCDRWIVQENGDCIACVEQDSKVGDGNANLIAAAPELLDALKYIVGCSTPMTSQQNECWPVMRAAIARATGGQP